MYGARIDACGECMRVHVHGGAWVNCTVWNAWEAMAGCTVACMPGSACMHVRW